MYNTRTLSKSYDIYPVFGDKWFDFHLASSLFFLTCFQSSKYKNSAYMD